MRIKRTVTTCLAMALALSVALPAGATPVATTKEKSARRWAAPSSSPSNQLTSSSFGPEAGDEEFRLGMELLEKLFPRYVEYTTIDKELTIPTR